MNNLLEKILLWDQKLFLYLNGLHSDSLDPLMIWISGKLTWLPFYVVILGFIAWHFRKRTIIVLVGIALTILFAEDRKSTRQLQSRENLVCRLLLEKKNIYNLINIA